MNTEKVLLKGNEAFAEAAMRGGARYYFGYPITPQSEIPEYLSRELPKHGGTFIQAESELGAINMAYGAAAAGGNVFISSSSPGIALMQEGMSFLCSAETPLVALNVSRCGPGIGGIQPAQADYYQVTRGGGNGDYHIPVFAPASIQEAVNLLYEATELSTYWQNPIMVLADGMIAQMMEPVKLPEYRELKPIVSTKPWAITGYDDHGGEKKRNVVKSLRLKPEDLEKHVEKLFEKYDRAEKELCRYELEGIEDAQIVFVAFGTMARITREAIQILASQGIKAGLLRPISLWPFPEAAFDKINYGKTKLIISSELSMGQMMTDVRVAVQGRAPVKLVHRTGGIVPSSPEIAQKAKALLEGLQ